MAREAALAGVDLIQVREKDLGGGALLALASEVVAAVEGTASRIFVNGRPDIARLAGAHGVHLPEEGLPPEAVKAAFPELLMGVSCHSLAGVLRAAKAGADYVVLGPVFQTPGKEERALGLTVLREAVRSSRVPVLAIGGIDASSAASVWAAGAAGICAIRAFLEGPLAEVARALRAHR